MRIACLLVWTCLVALTLSACSSEGEDMGIVARVNGHPIYLAQLEFQHDLLHMDGSGSFVPTVEELRGEYGRILGDLVVLELVSQELAARGLGVSDEELANEEAKVRADYPGDTFEQVLVEEYIDLAAWRERVRYHKAMEKFFQLVLRPQIKIDYREAEAYYKRHIKEFRIPETLRVLVLRAGEKKLLQEALRRYQAAGDPEATKEVENVGVHEITVRQGQLSASWLEALQSLPPGEASQIIEEKFGYEALVLLERLPAKLLDPTQAYPLVEEALLAEKLGEEFERWLSSAWEGANVQVSAHLLPQAAEADGNAVEALPGETDNAAAGEEQFAEDGAPLEMDSELNATAEEAGSEDAPQ